MRKNVDIGDTFSLKKYYNNNKLCEMRDNSART